MTGLTCLCAGLLLAPAGRCATRSDPARPAAGKHALTKANATGKPAAKPAPKPAVRPPARGKAGAKAVAPPPPPAAPPSRPAPSDDGPPERRRDEAEYERLQAELKLAQSDAAYLCFQWEPQPQLLVKVRGAVVENYKLRIDGDEGDVRRFRERFRGSERRVLRGVLQKYLYTARPQTPDSVLTIVGNVLKLDPRVMQREVPGWFELTWQDDLVLEVRADVEGTPVPGVDLKIVKLQQTLRRPFGEVRLRVHIDRREALTLYRLAKAGLPVLSPVY